MNGIRSRQASHGQRVYQVREPVGEALQRGGIRTERFAFNCLATLVVDNPATGETIKICTQPADQAFTVVGGIHGINRPGDGKFGPDGAFYLVDFGIVRDGGESVAASAVQVAANRPLVQIPGTGVIWRISRD